jgi:signal transduction histidine kinase
MDWIAELRQAFHELEAGGRARVSFGALPGTVGEVGREFNSLAGALEEPPGADARERFHRLRNQLAGILAALHVLRETAGLSAEEQASLGQALEDAKRLEMSLRPG